MSIRDFCGVDIKMKGDGALGIHDGTFIISYLQDVGEVLIGLTPKEWDMLCIKPNCSSGKAIPSYGCG
jgi:hypothetical protein